jgi:hypothetical protein
MSIRKHIEAADDALRSAIIEALEKKRDEQLETMFEALSKVRELILTTPIRSVDNVVSYYKNKAEYDFSLDLKDEDYGYKLNVDDINIFTNRHGKDLDSLDGPE